MNLCCWETGSPSAVQLGSSRPVPTPQLWGFCMCVLGCLPQCWLPGGSALRVCFPMRPGEHRNHPEQTNCLDCSSLPWFPGAGGGAGAQPVAVQGALPSSSHRVPELVKEGGAMEARPCVAVVDGLAGVSGTGLEACWPLQPEPEPQPCGGTDLIFLWRVSGLARSRGRPPDRLLDAPAVGGQGDSLPEAPPQSSEAVLLPFLGQADPLLHKVSRKMRGTEACYAPASGLLPSPCCCLPARISRTDAGVVASPSLGAVQGPGDPHPRPLQKAQG